MVVDMEIKRLKNTKFGTNKIARVVTGWALYEAGKGWIAFRNDRDQFGILVPYIPCGGKKALHPSWTPAASSASTEWNMSPNYKGPEGPFLLHFSVYYRKYFFLVLIIFFTFILDTLHFIVYNVNIR